MKAGQETAVTQGSRAPLTDKGTNHWDQTIGLMISASIPLKSKCSRVLELDAQIAPEAVNGFCF